MAAKRDQDPQSYLPLPSASLHVLLSLIDGDRHGYAIMREVERLSDGVVRMGPGTLYASIKRLLEDGLIEESDERPDPELDDQRRRYYRLTALGRTAAASEVRRLETLVQASRPWALEVPPT